MIRLLFILLLLPALAHADINAIIASSNRIDWANYNYAVTGPLRTRSENFTIYTNLPNVAYTVINSAIQNCPSNQVVRLTNGIYSIGGTILKSKNGVVLRGRGSGDGAGDTILRPTTTASPFIYIQGNYTAPSAGTAITAGLHAGDSNLTVASTTGLTIGALVQVDQTNIAGLIWDRDAGDPRAMKGTRRIDNISGNVVTIWPPLFYPITNNAPLMKHFGGNVVQYAGLEDLQIHLNGQSVTHGIWFQQAMMCWMKNVTFTNASAYHVYLTDSIFPAIVDSDLSFVTEHSNNHGSLLSDQGTTCGLYENNIFNVSFPALEINYGSSGNIFAYNLVKDAYIYGGPSAGIIVNHAEHSMMNLIEGNHACSIQNDGYHGSGSHNTYFRNRVTGLVSTGIGADEPGGPFATNYNSKAFDLCHISYYEQIVGNVLGHNDATGGYEEDTSGHGYNNVTIYRLGFPAAGGDTYTGSFSAIGEVPRSGEDARRDERVKLLLNRHYNKDYVTSTNGGIVWNGSTDQDFPASLYLTSKPSWFGNRSWPPIDPATYGNYAHEDFEIIPSGYRMLNGEPPPADGGDIPAVTGTRSLGLRFKR